MNLNSYDNVVDTIDKNKTWVDVKKKILLTREFKYRRYTTLIKRYNKSNCSYDYFIALSDTISENKLHKRTKLDDYGRIKINIKEIWNDTYLVNIDKDCNIMINLVEVQSDGEVYQLDV